MSQTRTITINPPQKKIMNTESLNTGELTETPVEISKKSFIKMQNNLSTMYKHNDDLEVENSILKGDADQKISHYSSVLKREKDRVKILEDKIKYYEERKNKTVNVKEEIIEVEDVEKRKQYRQEQYLKKKKEQEKAFEEWKRLIQ